MHRFALFAEGGRQAHQTRCNFTTNWIYSSSAVLAGHTRAPLRVVSAGECMADADSDGHMRGERGKKGAGARFRDLSFAHSRREHGIRTVAQGGKMSVLRAFSCGI